MLALVPNDQNKRFSLELGICKQKDNEGIFQASTILGDGFKYFLFSPLFGEMIQFD